MNGFTKADGTKSPESIKTPEVHCFTELSRRWRYEKVIMVHHSTTNLIYYRLRLYL